MAKYYRRIFSYRLNPLMIALIYLVISGLWIYYSDAWLSYFDGSVKWISTMQTYKGWFFVLATSVGLYFMIRAHRGSLYNVIDRLRKHRRELNTLIRNLPGMVMHYQVADLEKFDFISQGCEELTGYPAERFTRGDLSFRSLIPEDNRAHVLRSIQQQLDEKSRYLLTYRIKNANGEMRWIWEKGSLIERRDHGPYVEGLLIDITNEKQAEERLRNSLREKEVLLSEVHHRVKNNMALISSLLELQKIEIVDQEFHGVVDQHEKRIKAIAMVHEQLYHTDTLSEIRFDHYVKNMISNLFPSFAEQGFQRRMDFKVSTDPLVMNVNQAIPCALLLHELISYAGSALYNGRERPPRVNIFCATNQDDAELEVHFHHVDKKDLPDFEKDPGNSLPMLLVHTLLKQLDAHLEIDQNDGVLFRFSFTLD